MKLVQLAGQDSQSSMENAALRAITVNEMRAAAPILDLMEFYTMVGNSDTPPNAATEMGGASRAINSDYAGVVGAPSYGSLALKIYGDKIKTDMAYQRRGASIEMERVRELRSWARGLGRHIGDHLVNGAGTGNDISGLKTLLTGGYLKNYMASGTGSQVLMGSDNAAKKSQQDFLRELDDLIYSVGPTFLLMGGKTIAYLKAIGREYVKAVSSEDALSGSFESYNGIPIINAGKKKDNATLVIDNAETMGASTDCTSIYGVRCGEKEDSTLGTNVGVVVKDLGLVGSQYVTMVDFDLGLALLNASCAMRMQGVRLA